MKRLVLLKNLTTLLLASSVIGLFFGVPFVLLMVVMPESIPFKINGSPAATADLKTVLSLIALVAGLPFFTYALYLFRKVLELFKKKKIFNDDVIKNFNHIGKAIIIGYLIMAAPYMLYAVFSNNEVTFTVNFSPREIMLVLVAGLFFMVLSDVFRIAKKIKEENDLTV